MLILLGGILVDRFGAARMLVWTAAICLAGALLTALSPVYGGMVLGRLLFGIGGETFGIAVMAGIVKYFTGRNLAFAMGSVLAIARSGSFSADMSPTWFSAAYAEGWQPPLLIAVSFAVLSLAGAIGYWWIDRRNRGVTLAKHDGGAQGGAYPRWPGRPGRGLASLPRFAPHAARAHVPQPLESAAECGLGLESERLGHARDGLARVEQQFVGQVHPPLGEVMHRRRIETFAEAPGEVTAAHAGDRRQRLDIPLPSRLCVQRGQRLSELRIGERAQQAPVLPEPHVVSQHFDEERLGKPLHHRLEPRRFTVVLRQHVARERDELRRGLLFSALHNAHFRQGAEHEVICAGFELDDATDDRGHRFVLVLRFPPKVWTLVSLRRAAELVPLRAMEEQEVVLAQQQGLIARGAMQPQLAAPDQMEGRLVALTRIERPLAAIIAPRHQADPQPQGAENAGQHVAGERFRHESGSPGRSTAGLYSVVWHACREGTGPEYKRKTTAMPKYVIERDIPGAGNLTAEQLRGISQKSCSVLSTLGPKVQWQNSYVTGDRIYCVYIAENEELLREHARQGGFPANRISRVTTVIDPTTAEA